MSRATAKLTLRTVYISQDNASSSNLTRSSHSGSTPASTRCYQPQLDHRLFPDYTIGVSMAELTGNLARPCFAMRFRKNERLQCPTHTSEKSAKPTIEIQSSEPDTLIGGRTRSRMVEALDKRVVTGDRASSVVTTSLDDSIAF